MMKKLNYILLREIRQSKKEILTIAALIFLGMSVFVAYYLAYQNLNFATEQYYRQYQLFDYYVEAVNIPSEVMVKIKELEGVTSVIGRISTDLSCDLPQGKRITLRVISLPDRQVPLVNQISLVSGEFFNDKTNNLCLLEKKCAVKHELKIGSALKLIANLKQYQFLVGGLVISPEFLIPTKVTTLNSDFEQSDGIIYLKESVVRSILNYQDNYNQLQIRFDNRATRFSLIKRIGKIIKPYGFIRGVARQERIDYHVLNSEIKKHFRIAWFFGILALSIAGIMLNMLQKTRLNRQRIEINVLKTFGYSKQRLLRHYLSYVFLIGILGIVPAFLSGSFWGTLITKHYQQTFNIPVVKFHLFGMIFLLASLVTCCFCLLSCYQITRKFLSIKVSESCLNGYRRRPRFFLKRWTLIWGELSFEWKIVLRNLSYHWDRTCWIFWGSVVSIAVMIFSFFLFSSLDFGLRQHFNNLQQYDLEVVFNRPVSYYDIMELQKIEGISKIEPILEVRVNLEKDWRTNEAKIVGVVERSTLINLVNQALLPIQVSKSGIVLSEAIARKLGVRVGEVVFVKPYLGSAYEKPIKVIGIVKQYLDFGCYMEIKSLGELLGEGSFTTGALLKIVPRKLQAIKQELMNYPVVASVIEREVAFETRKNNYLLIYVFMVGLFLWGIINNFIIIHSSNKLNLNERQYDLGLLIFAGHPLKKIVKILFLENLILVLISFLPGIFLGNLIAYLFVKIFSYRVLAWEMVIYPYTYLITILISLCLVVLAQRANCKMTQLDFVSELKNREG